MYYSMNELLQEYYDRVHHIERNSINTMLNNMSLLTLTILIFLSFAIWIWSIVVLIKYWKVLPTWARVLGIIGLIPVLPLGPVITLVCVYVGKQK